MVILNEDVYSRLVSIVDPSLEVLLYGTVDCTFDEESINVRGFLPFYSCQQLDALVASVQTDGFCVVGLFKVNSISRFYLRWCSRFFRFVSTMFQ